MLRREAVKKLALLPTATEDQIHNYNDVCPICYQPLLTAKITPCGHFFHATCLKKWLYVKDTCPMCHKKLHETSEESQNSTEDRPAQNEDIVEDEDHGDADSEPSNHSEEQEFSEEDLD